MRVVALLTAGSLLIGCASGDDDIAASNDADAGGSAENQAESSSGWDLRSGGEGVTLVLGPEADAAIRLACPAGQGRLLVNVPAFRPIGSEERLSFGSGGEVVALVADTRGDAERGGVSATGAVPEDLRALIAGPVSASYGAQTSGPHQSPPEQLASAFAAACAQGEGGSSSSPAPGPDSAAAGPEEVGACRMENDEVLPPNRLKAVGTEPFWAARIEGRCVTYMTPENQSGTRIWASFDGSRDSGVWTGYYQDQRFVLRTRPSPGCSDGMSDKRYPVGVTLVVGGEERMGCAEYP